MRALRIVGQETVHATWKYVDFQLYAHTACNLRVAWSEPVGNSPLAKRVDEPVDCMTCLVNAERSKPSDMFKAINQYKLRTSVMLMSSEAYRTLVEGLTSPRDDPDEQRPLPAFPSNDPSRRR